WGRLFNDRLPASDIYASASYQTIPGPPSIDLGVMRIRTRDSRVEITGRISDLDNLRSDFQLKVIGLGRSDIARFAPLWSQTTAITGSAHLQGSRTGLHATFALDASAGRVDGEAQADFSKSEVTYQGTAQLTGVRPQDLLSTSPIAGIISGK